MIANRREDFKTKLNRSSLTLLRRSNFNVYRVSFYVPDSWSFVLVRKSGNANLAYCYFCSSIYFFIIPFPIKFATFCHDIKTGVVTIDFLFRNALYPMFWSSIKLIFYSFSRLFFKKLKFKGKGYYIYKNKRNTIAFRFGYSHLIQLYSFFTSVKFMSKTTVLLFGINSERILNRGHALFSAKPINVFTGKGVRFSRQIVYRKTGKVSSYK